MRYIVLIFLNLTFFNSLLGQDLNERMIDPDIEEEIIYGYGNREGLLEDPFSLWFDEEYTHYLPNKEVLDSIKAVPQFYKVVIVMATWCEDSRREVPRFFKIIDSINFDDSNLQMIMVNRKIRAEGTELDNFNVRLVPTFIFYNGNKEIGRIIEKPKALLEKDIFDIVFRGNG